MNNLYHSIYATNLMTVIVAMPIILLVWSVIGAVFFKKMRIIGTAAAVLAVAAILYVTLFSRGSRLGGLDLIPFSSFSRAVTNSEIYRSMLMNVLLFFPLGLSLPFVFKETTGKRILFTILSAVLLSLMIEAFQYVFSRGLAETDDVICNTLGAVTGSCAYLITVLIRNITKRIRRQKTH